MILNQSSEYQNNSNPLIEFLLKEMRIVRDLRKKQLRAYLLDHLAQVGFRFASEDEADLFLIDRVTIVSYEVNPSFKEVYLDFVDADNKGRFIGSYSDSVDFDFDGDKINIKIG